MRNVALTDEQKAEIYKLWEDGVPVKDIAEKFHINKRTANRYTTEIHKRKHTSKEERAEMQTMYKQGYAIQDIADEFGISMQTVCQYTTKLGIKREHNGNDFWKAKTLEEWDDVCKKIKNAKRKVRIERTCASGKTFR